MTYPGQNFMNIGVLVLAVVLGGRGRVQSDGRVVGQMFSAIMALSLLFGVLLIIPIGGADMPTVISHLEFLRRPVGGCDGICAQQQAADHRRGRWTARAA